MDLRPALIFDYLKTHPDGPVCENCGISEKDNPEMKFILIDYANKNDDGTLEKWRKMFCEKCNNERKN